MKREKGISKKREKKEFMSYLPRIDLGPLMCLQAIFLQRFIDQRDCGEVGGKGAHTHTQTHSRNK